MAVIKSYPPNIDAIAKVFPEAKRIPTVIFAYGNDIYNPSGNPIPQSLVMHEAVHCLRQEQHAGGVEGWWQQYLEDPQFRLMEELLAHRAEYNELIRTAPNRQARRGALKYVATRLSGPLYGRMISHKTAEKWITEEVDVEPQPA